MLLRDPEHVEQAASHSKHVPIAVIYSPTGQVFRHSLPEITEPGVQTMQSLAPYTQTMHAGLHGSQVKAVKFWK
jgi:hypothetical protein